MNKLQYILTKLSEECAELSKEASKASIFGMDSYHPQDLSRSTQTERICLEFLDVSAVFGLLVEYLEEFDPKSYEIMDKVGDVDELIEAKMTKVKRYMEHSRSLGLVDKEDDRGQYESYL